MCVCTPYPNKGNPGNYGDQAYDRKHCCHRLFFEDGVSTKRLKPSPMSVNVIGEQNRKRYSYDGMNYCPHLPDLVVIAMSGCVQTYARQNRK